MPVNYIVLAIPVLALGGLLERRRWAVGLEVARLVALAAVALRAAA